ncbi:MAG: sigma-70 family RNA polymerase sigma factor [Candidatus Eisenbacteria bacterium]|uniref:Sigma-70 family RNA polymerase sigma factor n=1 Tax=Eiseniibacteriota bacterium TaxID=2212470 RepID=A0A956M018_UNCEI|nr:sigma-70 family RNA polymerase sigma factor [Candidatus Eisenbacteria bacterium]
MTGESTQPALGFWEAAFQEHGGSLLRFLSSRVRRREDAEDLLQEIFVRAMRARTDRSEPDNPRAYLFTTAQRVLQSHVRAGARRGADLGLDEAAAESAEPKATSGLETRELRRQLERATGRMTRPERIAFEHALLEHKPYEQIAREQGWSREQVKINVYRARKRALETLGAFLRPSE